MHESGIHSTSLLSTTVMQGEKKRKKGVDHWLGQCPGIIKVLCMVAPGVLPAAGIIRAAASWCVLDIATSAGCMPLNASTS